MHRKQQGYFDRPFIVDMLRMLSESYTEAD